MDPRLDGPAAAVRGVRPDGSSVEVGVDLPGALIFLTSSCKPCQPYWEGLRADASIALITPDPTTEDRRRVARLAARSPHPVVMSTDGWMDYGVSKAPWLVIVSHGAVVAAQPAPSQPAEALVLLDRLCNRGHFSAPTAEK
jgi:hypothetical protein